MADWNEQFTKSPLTFVQDHALYPVEAEALQHIRQRLKSKNFNNQEVSSHDEGEGKISYCSILPANLTPWENIIGDGAIANYKNDYNLYIMRITPGKEKETDTSFPVYFLPWSMDQGFRMKLKPNHKHPAMVKGHIVEPDFFIASALQDWAVMVEGDRKQPVVYHVNVAVSGDIPDPDITRARRTAQDKLNDMNRRYLEINSKEENYTIPTGPLSGPYSDNPDTFWKPLSSFANWFWEIENFEVLQYATVFGVRKEGEWAFYRQTRNRVTYEFRPVRWFPVGTKYNTQYYDEWRDMRCVQFWP